MTPLTRRSFLGGSLFAAAAPLAGLRAASESEPAKPVEPGRKINIGMIGMGRQAMWSNLAPFLQSPDCRVVAVCDVDAWRLDQALAAVKAHDKNDACKAHRDFRELLARPDIDAVMISTPDHWHVPMAIAAIKAGKDVALEKPATRYINEGRLLADLAAKHRRVFRVDSEFRSIAHFHLAASLVRNGRIGKLLAIRTGSPTEAFPKEAGVPGKPPPDLDYDLWLGPAREVEYMQKRVHPQRNNQGRPGWMRCLDYCDGMITNWGTHLNDIAQWGAGTERTGPVEVKASGKFHDDPDWNVLESFDAWYKFANGLELFYQMGAPHVRFEGESGWIQVDYPGKITASDPAILRKKPGPGELQFPLRSEKVDFIEAVKTRGPTLEDAEVGHRTTSLCHLAHISIQLGGVKLAWDPDKEVFPGNDAANKLAVRPPMRGPWSLS